MKFAERSIQMGIIKCIGCGKNIADDSENSFDEWFCWKCEQVPSKGADWKWELYHPYDHLQEEIDEEA